MLQNIKTPTSPKQISQTRKDMHAKSGYENESQGEMSWLNAYMP